MLISQKSEYGIRALVDIYQHGQDKPVNRSEIAERQRIPLPYLTQVLSALVNGDLLDSTRGPAGGYRLNRDPGDVSLLEVVTLLQGPVSPTYCAGSEDAGACESFQGCGLAGVWSRLKSANEQVLGQTTLSDILSADPERDREPVLTADDQDEPDPDRKLDCIGSSCPMPIVKMAEIMMELETGQVLEVWADDEGAKADIPAWCTGTGNDFIGREEYGPEMKFLVRKA